MEKNESTQITSITMLRGIAALMVCIYHFTGTLPDLFWHNEVAYYGKYGVNLFFVISGFIIPYSMFKSAYQLKFIGRFLLKRTLRIEPVYLASIVLIILIAFIAKLSPFSTNHDLNYWNANTLLHVFYLVDFFDGNWYNQVFWTLAIEFQFYILVALIFNLVQSGNEFVQISILLASVTIPFVTQSPVFIFSHLLLFVPGYLCYVFYVNKVGKNHFILILILLCILLVIKSGILVMFCPLIVITCILFVKKTNRFLLFLGKISFSIYLLHTPIGTDGIINFCQNFIHSESGRIILMLTSIPVLIFASWFFYKLVEEPAINLSKKIKVSKKLN